MQDCSLERQYYHKGATENKEGLTWSLNASIKNWDKETQTVLASLAGNNNKIKLMMERGKK